MNELLADARPVQNPTSPALLWSEEAFGVDITSVDRQHEDLTTRLTALFSGVEAGMPANEVVAEFSGVVEEVRRHFAYEEDVMRNIGLPSYMRHKQQHDRLLLDIEGYRKSLPDRLLAGKFQEVRDYLSHWLVTHMAVEDRLIREHIQGKRAEPDDGERSSARQDRAVLLIVDDVPSNIQIIAEILRAEYEMVFATSGEDALRVARESLPDVILLDIMMPDMDGLTVCSHLKSDPILADVPVIFITAMGETKDEAIGLELGAIDYITKPVSPPIVRARVRNHLELKRQRDMLRRVALVDGLTGIANRRRFDAMFEQEWRRAVRQNSPLSLIMADIDFFKGYNDHYGHQSGDECLRLVAATIACEVKRPSDLVARYGGEEFVCLLSDTSLDGALAVAEKMRRAIEQLRLPHAASAVGSVVSASFGVAASNPVQNDTKSDLLALADYQLYEAKKAGRNRCCGASLGEAAPRGPR